MVEWLADGKIEVGALTHRTLVGVETILALDPVTSAATGARVEHGLLIGLVMAGCESRQAFLDHRRRLRERIDEDRLELGKERLGAGQVRSCG